MKTPGAETPDRLRAAFRWLLITAFLVAGFGHFYASSFFVAIMPPYLPYHLELVWLSGVCEIAGALGLIFRQTRKPAGIGLMMLTVAVFPANVHMALNPGDYPAFSSWMLMLRLPFQAVILAWIWWVALARGATSQPVPPHR